MSVHLNVPIDEYHDAPYLTSSLLRSFMRSPRLYQDEIEARAKKKPRAESDAMKFGSAAHCFLLEPDRWQSEYIVKPADMDFRTKAGQSWRDAHLLVNHKIVTAEETDTLNRMLCRMPTEIMNMLRDPANQFEITVRQKLGDIDAQARLDVWNPKARAIYDLKSVGAVEKIERAIYTYGYAIQMRMYQQIVALETGARPTATMFFVETAPPFRWRIATLDASCNMRADAEIADALSRLHECVKTGDWSDPADINMLVSLPSWLEDREDEE